MVKADAYGHGIALAVPALLACGCDFFAVATAEEALAVRALAPEADILLLGAAPLSATAALARQGVTQTAFSLPYARALSQAAREAGVTAAVHIKLDGGMCRLGFLPCEREAVLEVLRLQNLRVTGLFTHFPCADTAPQATLCLLRDFCALRDMLPKGLFAHAAASAAACTLPCAVLDGARFGLSLYGYSPVPLSLVLRPALRLLAPLVQIHEVGCGTPVGYGAAFVTARPSRIGTLPCGYADGFSRSLSGSTVTLEHEGRGYPVPIVGRVCMDYCMVDLTDTPASEGDNICLIADAAATAAYRGTIPYEVLSGISHRVPRVRK